MKEATMNKKKRMSNATKHLHALTNGKEIFSAKFMGRAEAVKANINAGYAAEYHLHWRLVSEMPVNEEYPVR